MEIIPDPINLKQIKPDWYHMLSKYAKSDFSKSLIQFLTSVIPYLALWGIMIWLLHEHFPYWMILLPIFVSAIFLVRIFIIFHDCVHGSYFDSPSANKMMGYIAGILTFTSFEDWQHSHNIHHATYANLDKRGVGDIWTLTVNEYLMSSGKIRFWYRIYRNPFFLIILIPGILFLVLQRFSTKVSNEKGKVSILLTNVILLFLIAAACWTIGWKTYLLIQIPVMWIAGIFGVWLFYIQHQFEGVFWMREKDWDPLRAALEGSSYYCLPKILQWMTGNIGIHHVHHVLTRIPNYNLQRCYNETSILQGAKSLSFGRSLKSLHLNLWDEKTQKLVSFAQLREMEKET